MKVFLQMSIIIWLTIWSVKLHSQTTKNAVISLDKIKIIYLGIDNPISVAVPNFSSDKLKVTINNGVITGNNGKYVIKVDTGKISIIEIFTEISPGNTVRIGIDTFEIYNYPNLRLCIGNFCGFGYEYFCLGSVYNSNIFIPKDELLKNDEIRITYDSPLNCDLKVKSFTFISSFVNGTDTVNLERKIEGNRFTKEIIDNIKSISTESKITLSQIRVLTPNGNIGFMNSVTITIL